MRGYIVTKKEKRKKLHKLLKQWTKAEIVARLVPFANLQFIDYALKGRKKIDAIRKLLYGTSDIGELGERWGLLEKKKKKR